MMIARRSRLDCLNGADRGILGLCGYSTGDKVSISDEDAKHGTLLW